MNTIILHIQMGITPGLYLFLSLVSLTSFIPGLVDSVSFSKNQATHPLALQHYILRLSILNVFLISNVFILIYVWGIFRGYVPVTPESGSKDVKMSPSQIQTLGTKGPGAQGDPYCS